MKNILSIKNLKVSIKNTTSQQSTKPNEILSGITFSLKEGEIHALMGPNGSGKSTLALSLIGHPNYLITNGSIIFEGKDITPYTVTQRAQAGIFLSFQDPYQIEGVTTREFLYQAYQAKQVKNNFSIADFEQLLTKNVKLLNIPNSLVERPLNVGFSGGEKKHIEMLQLALLQPKFVILDEIDSGLDIDALKIICHAILTLKQENPALSLLIITHYPRILRYLIPDTVHVMQKGKIIESGTKKLADEIEKEGYRNK